MTSKKLINKHIVNKHEQKFAKYLVYAVYLFAAFLVATAIQTFFDLIFTSFSETAAWSLLISIRLLLIMLAVICVLVFFIYLILYALKEE